MIDKNLWLKLKQGKIKCVSRKSDKKLYAYGSKQPLNVLGTFSALARVEGIYIYLFITKKKEEKKPKPNLLLLMAKRRHCLKEKLLYSQAC